MKKAFAVLTLFFSALGLNAQDSLDFPNSINVPVTRPPYPCITINNVFIGDYLLGFSSGVYYEKYDVSTRLGFNFRPYFKSVTFKENDTLRHQYKEKDFYLHLTLEKEFRFKTQYPMLRPFVQADFGLLWGNFKAFKKAPENKWILGPAAGLNLALTKTVNFKLGYQYLRPLVLQSSPHRLIFQIMFLIPHE